MDVAAGADRLVAEGLNFHRRGDRVSAETLFRDALKLVPGHPGAMHYLGTSLFEKGETAAGLALMERSVKHRPDLADFHHNLGIVYRAAGKRERSIAAFREAARRLPGSVHFNASHGLALWEAGRLDPALEALDRAVSLDPKMAQCHLARGAICGDTGRLDEALAAYQKAGEVAEGSDLASAQHNYLYALNFHPAFSTEAIFEAHRQWAGQNADALGAGASPFAVDPDGQRRLKVGYVSPHFRTHAVNFFIEPVLTAHDRTRFEIICYDDGTMPDATTARLRASVDGWREVAGCSDAELTELVRADGIDVLVDLCGHMGKPRLFAFARRAAPVQVTYLGYQATTGLAAMDYRLTDAYADPPGVTDGWHTEKLWRLPEVFYCYRPPAEAPPVVDAPMVKRQAVTFGSFNNFAKVTSEVLLYWAAILRRVAGSRLQILIPDSDSLQQRVRAQFVRAGVDGERIKFVKRSPLRKYLAQFQTVDIALDPFPFNGHTTSLDALWMGVPTVMLAGQSYVQRYGSAALVHLGLEELIAATPESYVEIAVAWASQPARLIDLRRTLRERMRASVLCDAEGFTRRLETAYRQMRLALVEA